MFVSIHCLSRERNAFQQFHLAFPALARFTLEGPYTLIEATTAAFDVSGSRIECKTSTYPKISSIGDASRRLKEEAEEDAESLSYGINDSSSNYNRMVVVVP